MFLECLFYYYDDIRGEVGGYSFRNKCEYFLIFE
jgi:hypothetical protein